MRYYTNQQSGEHCSHPVGCIQFFTGIGDLSLERRAMASAETRRNKQVIFRDYVDGTPKESDMIVRDSTLNMSLKAADDRGSEEGSGAMLVKNLYLSCDPYMGIIMRKLENNKTFTSLTPGSVCFNHSTTSFNLLCDFLT